MVAPQHGGNPALRPRLRELVQRQARALGDPTRFTIYQYISESPAPVRVAELARHLQCNPTAVRQHLAKLCDARLLVEESAPPGRSGRPPRQYRVAPSAMGTWGAPGPYELLSLMLLEVARDHGDPVQSGRDAGRRIAAEYDPAADPLDVIEAEMARRGFEPRREPGAMDVDLVLDRCPFQAAAAADPEMVCGIHRGLAEGLLEGLGADLEVSALVPVDPVRAGCRLKIRPTSGGRPSAG